MVHEYAGDSDPAEKAELKSCEGGGMGMNGVGSAGNERGHGSRRCLNYFPDTQVRSRAKVKSMRFVILVPMLAGVSFHGIRVGDFRLRRFILVYGQNLC